jgi:Protein of unknown function (DUF1549)/Protein of unknown function (DUF1553)
MRIAHLPLAALAALLVHTGFIPADELLPPGRPIEQVIDHYIDLNLKEENVKAVGQADDATLIRRLTLDLVGRIPTVSETRAFVESTDPDKRAKLVDRLMPSPAFTRHQATEIDTVLMASVRGTIRDYLLKALTANRGWDQVFREVMLPDETRPDLKGAGEFLRQRVTDLDKVTADVSSLFFGVNVSCARCHDHPLVMDWKQDHFFGMKSFFNRTFDNGGFLGEREYGVVKFKTVKGLDKQANFMFLTGKVIEVAGSKDPSNDEQKKERERLETAKKNKTAPPAPKVSARGQLVDLALQPEQRGYFARAFVNRTWYRLFGFGLVMPLDQMHSANPPSHPELLDWLARDTAENRYELRRLVRGLVMSKAYSRSSRWESNENFPLPKLFAVARVRPLTPMQLATSLRLATSDATRFGPPTKPDEVERQLDGIEGSARGYASMFEQPGEDFQISVTEALLFSNGDRIQKEMLNDGGGQLIGLLKLSKDRKAAIDLAVRTVLCRPPQEDESKLMEQYLKNREDRPVEAYRQLVWALLTSAEFRFNH